MNSKTLQANLILIIAAAIWGCAFAFQRQIADDINSATVMFFRFAIASVCLLPILLINKNKSQEIKNPTSPKITIAIISSGIALFAACFFQQWGIEDTTAGKAGFITGMYVVMIPLMGLLWGQMPNKMAWVGVTLAIVGLYFLSIKDGFKLSQGDLKVLVCAFICAVYGHIIGWVSPKVNAVKLAFWQYSISTLLGFLLIIFLKINIQWSALSEAWVSFFYLGVISTALGFTLQTIGQKTINPTNAAIILSLETVFAALSGFLMLGETLSQRAIFGCALMLSGMLVAQIGNKSST
jgi:drug/metabolite transporter (DMT)-like permease